MSYFIPRFQGRAIEKDGGWTFEFIVSMLGDDEHGEMFGCKIIYPTRDEAIEALKAAIQSAIKRLSENMPEVNPETYIDMKTNATRRWDKKDEN